MCTATYLPTSNSSFILSHSRDENAIRPAARPPQTFTIGGQAVAFPHDPQGNGTWIAASAHTAVCLLNGAFKSHQPNPPYRHSRGLVIPHFFAFPTLRAFADTYDFCNIEPFTLLVAEAGRLMELGWNGTRLFMHEKDPQRPHIWSSVTLYAPEVIVQREGWFRDWQHQHTSPSVESIRHFHKTAGDGNAETSVRMNRQDSLLTLSLTSIIHTNESASGQVSHMIYEDFTRNLLTHHDIRPTYAIA
jgi:hypothetical protein